MTLAVYSEVRQLGSITLDGGKLTGTGPALQNVADVAVKQAGGDPAKAYAQLDGFTNGYITIITDPAEQDAGPGGRPKGGPARAAFRPGEARDEHGRWTSGGTAAGKAVLAAVDRGLARFRQQGERMADEPLAPAVAGHFAGLLDKMGGKLRKQADRQRWDKDLGVRFTRFALDPDVSGSRVHVATDDHGGIAGAVSFYEHTEEDPRGTGEDTRFVYVDYLGTTGTAAGAGTALAHAVARYAAARHLGVMGDPVNEDAGAFWAKLGWHEDPYDLGSGFYGWTPGETAEVARAR